MTIQPPLSLQIHLRDISGVSGFDNRVAVCNMGAREAKAFFALFPTASGQAHPSADAIKLLTPLLSRKMASVDSDEFEGEHEVSATADGMVARWAFECGDPEEATLAAIEWLWSMAGANGAYALTNTKGGAVETIELGRLPTYPQFRLVRLRCMAEKQSTPDTVLSSPVTVAAFSDFKSVLKPLPSFAPVYAPDRFAFVLSSAILETERALNLGEHGLAFSIAADDMILNVEVFPAADGFTVDPRQVLADLKMSTAI